VFSDCGSMNAMRSVSRGSGVCHYPRE